MAMRTMNKMAEQTVDDIAGIMRALADPNRIRIINLLLARRELCVCDIQRVLKLPQTRVSRHLTILKNAGIVSARRDGRWMHYALRYDNALPDELQHAMHSTFTTNYDLVADISSLRTCDELQCRETGQQ